MVAEMKAKIKRKWFMDKCWVCGKKFRVLPEDSNGVWQHICSWCKPHVEQVEKLQGIYQPGVLYILQSLAERIEKMERSVGYPWDEIRRYH